jgi:hypothetical protein
MRTLLIALVRYVPTADLVKIFSMVGKTVNASAIEECHAIFVAGRSHGSAPLAPGGLLISHESYLCRSIGN